MSTLGLRSLLRRIAALSSIHPIEVILLTFIIVTLTYFQLLHTIKHSDLCVPSLPSSHHERRPSL
jgi:hydroxymethylglutaryl-CoA reductase (NADPH)